MNRNSEQVRPDLSLDMAQDQVLSPKQQQEAMIRFLGDKHCKIQEVAGKRVFTYFANGKTYILLHRAVSILVILTLLLRRESGCHIGIRSFVKT